MDKNKLEFFVDEHKKNHKIVASRLHNIYNKLSNYSDVICKLDIDQILNSFQFAVSHTDKVEALKKDKSNDADKTAMLAVDFSPTYNEHIYQVLSEDDEHRASILEEAIVSYYLNSIIHEMKCHPVGLNTASNFVLNNVPGFRQAEENKITAKKNHKVVKTMLETILKDKNSFDELSVTKRVKEFKEVRMLSSEDPVEVVLETVAFKYKLCNFELETHDNYLINIKKGEY